MGGGAGQGTHDSQSMIMSLLGVPSPVSPTGFGSYGQEKMRAMLRQMMAKNPADPLPFGLPPTSPADMNKMLLASFGQNSAMADPLKPPGNTSPAVRPNVTPMSV